MVLVKVDGFTCTRSLLEAVLRREALSDRSGTEGGGGSGGRRAPLTYLNGRSAAELLLDDGGGAVTGAPSNRVLKRPRVVPFQNGPSVSTVEATVRAAWAK